MNVREVPPSKPPMPRSRMVAVGFALFLAIAGAHTALALDVGSRAPEIGRKDLSGRSIRIGDFRGKVVLVDFWASWCAPCREEMPVLERLYRRYRSRGLVIVGVSVDRTEGNIRGFLRRTRVSFPIVHDPEHQIANRYRPPRMPSSYLIDKRGIVRYVHAGFRASDAERFADEIEQLLR